MTKRLPNPWRPSSMAAVGLSCLALVLGPACTSDATTYEPTAPGSPATAASPEGSGGLGDAAPSAPDEPISILPAGTSAPSDGFVDARVLPGAWGRLSAAPDGSVCLAHPLSETQAAPWVLSHLASDGSENWRVELPALRVNGALHLGDSCLLFGAFEGTVAFGEISYTSTVNPADAAGNARKPDEHYHRGLPSPDGFVSRFDAAGLQWFLPFTGYGVQEIHTMVALDDSRLLALGEFVAELGVASQVLRNPHGALEALRFVTLLSHEGDVSPPVLLDEAFGRASHAAVDAAGHVVLAARSPDSESAMIAELDAARLTAPLESDVSVRVIQRWRREGGAIGDLALDDAGNVYLTIAPTTSNGVEVLGLRLQEEAALVKLDRAGDVLWTRSVQGSSSMAVEVQGERVALTGSFSGAFLIDGFSAVQAQQHDFFFEELGVDGARRFAFTVGGAGLDGGYGVSALNDGWLVEFYASEGAIALGASIPSTEGLMWLDVRR